jgi:hypothetical protein
MGLCTEGNMVSSIEFEHLNPTTTLRFVTCASSCGRDMRHGFALRCPQPIPVLL